MKIRGIMSFWGEERTVNGVTFLAHVENSCFSNSRDGVVDMVLVTNIKNESSDGKAELKEVENKYLNKDYKEWLSIGAQNEVYDKLDELKSLAIQDHYENGDDPWYSCPKSEGGCVNEDEGDECNCGTDRHNKKVHELYNKIHRLLI